MWLSGHCEGLVVEVGEYILSTIMLAWLRFVFQHKLLAIAKLIKKKKMNLENHTYINTDNSYLDNTVEFSLR